MPGSTSPMELSGVGDHLAEIGPGGSPAERAAGLAAGGHGAG